MSAIEMIAAGLLVLLLVPISWIDLRVRRIPNELNLLLAASGLVYRLLTASGWQHLFTSLIAPIAILALFLTLIAVMRWLRRPGTLGLGDVKFLAAASLWVGFVGTTLVFVIASLLALIFTLARAPWRKLDLRAAIPFGPFLAASLALIFMARASY